MTKLMVEKICDTYMQANQAPDIQQVISSLIKLQNYLTGLKWSTFSRDETDQIWLWVEKAVTLCRMHLETSFALSDFTTEEFDFLKQTFKGYQPQNLKSTLSKPNYKDSLLTLSQITTIQKRLNASGEFGQALSLKLKWTKITDSNTQEAIENLSQAFLAWQHQSSLSGAEVHQRLGNKAIKLKQHDIAKYHYQRAIEQFCEKAKTSYEEDFSYRILSYTKALQLLPKWLTPPISNESLNWAFTQCDLMIAFAHHTETISPIDANNLLSLTYFTRGLLFSMHQPQDARFARSAFRKSAFYIGDPEKAIAYFAKAMSDGTSSNTTYQEMIKGLYFALWLDLGLSQNQLWELTEQYLAEGETLHAQMIQDMLFPNLTDFNQLSFSSMEREKLVSQYLIWFKALLKSKDQKSFVSAWKPLQSLYQQGQIVIDSNTLSALKKHKLIVTERINSAASAVVLEKEDTLDAQLEEVMFWLNKLSVALIQERRKSTEIALINMDETDITLLIKEISTHRAAIENHKKACPNVLAYFNAILTRLTEQGIHDLDARLQLAKLYMVQKQYTEATHQFKIILLFNKNQTDALIGLATCAYEQHRFEAAANWCEKALATASATTRASITTLHQKVINQQVEFQTKLSKIRRHRENPNAIIHDINQAIKITEQWLSKLEEKADIFPYLLFERAMLKVCRAQHMNQFYVKKDSAYYIDCKDYRDANKDFKTMQRLLPQSHLPHIGLGKTNRLAGQLLFTFVENTCEEGNDAQKQSVTQEAIESFKRATEHFTAALAINPECIQTQWELVQLHEHSGEYEKAKKYCESIYTVAGSNPIAQRARLKIAELYTKLSDYEVAYRHFQSILDEMDIPDSAFSQANTNQQICTLIRLYCATARAAEKAGYSKEAFDLLCLAKTKLSISYCHDFHGINLFYLCEFDLKSTTWLFALANKLTPKMPVLVKNGTNYTFYNVINDRYVENRVNLGNINQILSEYGICIAPNTELVLRGIYPKLYHLIQMKIYPERVEPWDNMISEKIERALEKLKSKLDSIQTIEADVRSPDEAVGFEKLAKPEVLPDGVRHQPNRHSFYQPTKTDQHTPIGAILESVDNWCEGRKPG